MSGAGERAGAPVHIDDELFDADLARLPETARTALQTARRRYEQSGVLGSERRHCDAEHPSGTRLPGCLKVYIPDFAGQEQELIVLLLQIELSDRGVIH